MHGLTTRILVPVLLLACVLLEWSRGGDSLPTWVANLAAKTGLGADRALRILIALLTLSLMRPWAAVGEHRYVIEHSGIVVDGELDDVVSSMQASGSAVTAEYLDLEGFDFGF